MSGRLLWNSKRVANYEDDRLVARYSTGDSSLFFGWEDRRTANASILAETFLERYPEIAEAGKGRDWTYSGWLNEVLGFADKGLLPVAIEEYGEDGVVRLIRPDRAGDFPFLPLPPPGEAPQTPE
jgi:hypothetical protein